MSLTGDPLFIAAEVEYRYRGTEPAGSAAVRRRGLALPAALARMLRAGPERHAATRRPGLVG